MKGTVGVGLLALGLCAPTSAARAEGHARVFVNGGFSATSLDFGETRKFTEFAEEGTIATRYEDRAGPGFELGLQYNFARHLGVAASFSLSSRNGSAAFTAALPHPLYLNRPRAASGEVNDLSYKENAGLLNLVWTGSSGRWDFLLFAGPAIFRVTSDLVQRVEYAQSYPYDVVSVTGVPKASFTDNPLGFDVGASLDYRLGARFGLGAQARFSRATARLVPSQGNAVEIDAGGLQVAGGMRLYF